MPQPTLAWIASYPKSGNTWMRLFLANYLVGGEQPLPINQVHRFVCFDASAELYRSAGLPPFDPVRQPRAGIGGRARMLRWLAGRADLTFVKTHMPRQPLAGCRLIPDSLTRAALCIVRDPRDVALSFARHFGTTPDQATAVLSRSDYCIPPNEKSVAQPVGGWSAHVAGWTAAAARPAALSVRYEDMLDAPEPTFARVVTHFGLPLDTGRLRRALAHASFEELQRQEATTGFGEHPRLRERFFHTGTAGQWRADLPPAAARRIEADHAAQMTRFGYLQA